MKSNRLTLSIFIALILGVLFGWLFPHLAVKMQFVADAFLKMIKMIIAPLIFSTLVVGIAGHGDIKSVGKIGLKTIVYFEVVTTIALFLGLFMANVLKPGVGFNFVPTVDMMSHLQNMQAIQSSGGIKDIILHTIPSSIFDALAQGELLQIVFFAIFFAFAIGAVGQKARPVLDFLQSVCEIMFKFTEYVMFFAPIGVFAAISVTVGQNGIQILTNYAKLTAIVYFSLIVFVVFVLAVVCKIIRVPIAALIKAIKEPALLAFSTASSEAALPKAMEIMEKFGVPKNIVSFVMPVGYTFNLDGTTLYLSLTAMFCAQIAGIDLSLGQQFMIMLTLMLTSKGVAGVPRVSLVILLGTLSSSGIPVIGVAILLGIDQILDMGRTTVNLIGNCVATAVVAKWENEFDYEKLNNFMMKETIKKEARILIKKMGINPFSNEYIKKSSQDDKQLEHIK